jgi:hypothetical protein
MGVYVGAIRAHVLVHRRRRDILEELPDLYSGSTFHPSSFFISTIEFAFSYPISLSTPTPHVLFFSPQITSLLASDAQ